MQNAHRLIFVNALTVYVSYQHPIAFLSNDQLFIRDGYWTRRRGERQMHVTAILQDARNQVSDKKSIAMITTDELAADLYSEFALHGIATPGKASPSRKSDNEKRRVKL